MKKSGLSVIAAVAIVISALSSVKTEDHAIRIGLMACLSAECAEWGRNSQKGVELAAEEINAAGGISGRKIEISVQDSQDTVPASTVAAYKALALDPAVNFIIGPNWTAGAMSVAPLIKARRDHIVVSPSVGIREFNETADNIFNIWPHDEIATRKLAEFALEKGWKKAAVFSSQDPWCRTQSDIFQEEYRKLGGTIATAVEPTPSTRDLRAEALKIKTARADVIFMANYQMDPFARELRNLQVETPKLAILMYKDRVIAAQGALEDTIFAAFESAAVSFKDSYRKRYSEDPGIPADTAYDATRLLAAAIGRVGADPEKVKYELLNTRDFAGASGTFSVDEKGGVNKKPVLWQVKGLEYRRVMAY